MGKNEELEKCKKERKFFGFMTIILVLVLLFIVVVNSDFSSPVERSEVDTCEKTYIVEAHLHPYERFEIYNKVTDFFVQDKEPSKYYYRSICEDLLNDSLEDTLKKSDKLWVYVSDNYYLNNGKLGCSYEILWTGEKGEYYYDRVLEKGKKVFDPIDVFPLVEKTPPKFNKSDIEVEWIEDSVETRITNYNSDYFVSLTIQLEEPMERCS